MSKHTPGPWELNIGAGTRGYRGNYEITAALTTEHEANASLIAAAPEMLAMLQHLQFIAESMPAPKLGEWHWPQVAKDIKRVIAKATATK